MKPILFNTEMVRAILEGRKTVTRRVVKNLPERTYRIEQNEKNIFEARYNGAIHHIFTQSVREIKPPYAAGDILYIRETWKKVLNCFWYKAGFVPESIESVKWRPSIHMPKAAARIFLKVTDVRVERLQDITEAQAKAEGIQAITKDEKLFKYAVSSDWWIKFHEKNIKSFVGSWWQDMPKTAKEAFSYLWNSTLGRKGMPEYYSNCWKGNPYVWVIEFERISKEEAEHGETN